MVARDSQNLPPVLELAEAAYDGPAARLPPVGRERLAQRARHFGSCVRFGLDEPEAMRRLRGVTGDLADVCRLDVLLSRVLDGALSLTGADFGNIQLLDPVTGALRIVTQSGFGPEFLEYFAVVDDGHSACGRAAQAGAQAVFADVTADAGFAPHRDIAAASGFRAVQSTPLANYAGRLIGMVSTHFRRPGRPSARDLQIMDLYGDFAGEAVARRLGVPDGDGTGDPVNVSHEFRTPLTLMLAPLEEIVRRSPELPAGMAAEVELVQRNARRLLRLVGTLLDLSQAEAGRLRARFAPTDLAGLTAKVTSAFRSAAEAAGLKLTVGAPSLPEPVWVDAGMWEKIVANLVSNALKFTWEGGIEVSLRALPRHAELVVRDTGVGIPADELPFVFERFHRAREARGRTHEGAGTGLALVDELVRLHHGRVRATSVEGAGTTVTVWVPLKQRPGLQQDASRAVRTGDLAAAMAAEAARWDAGREQAQAALGLDDRTVPLAELPRRAVGARIVIADDNPDMRDYLTRLLSPSWEVQAACDGAEALIRIRQHPPDLILADVMMPGQDGFALLRAIRADPALAATPVVPVTARAGEENAIEGLLAGADDYVVKPFSARELLARVGAQLELSRARLRAAEADAFRVRLIDALRAAADGREAEARAALLLLEHLHCAGVSYGEFEDGYTLAVHAAATAHGVVAGTSRWDLTWWHTAEVRADLEAGRPVVIDDVRSDPRIAAQTRASYADRDAESLVQAPVVKDGRLVAMLFAQDSAPRQWRDDEVALIADTGDRTWQAIQRARAELALRESEARLRSLIEASFDVVYRMSPDWTQMRTLMGRGFLADTVDPTTRWLDKYVDMQDRPMVLAAIQHAISAKSVFELEHRVKRPDGTLGWTLSRAVPLLGDDGEIVEWIGTATDVTARRDVGQRPGESEQ